jgi:hypothetical protein
MPLLVKGLGREASGALSNNCRLARRVALSSSQSPQTSKSKSIDDASLQGIYNRLLWELQDEQIAPIIFQVWGVKVLGTHLFNCPPQVLGSSNVN